ncbi:MAG: OmpA family protein [Gemmobacter sp.]
MRRTSLKTSTALSLSLAALILAPRAVIAQQPDPETLALFTPEVAQCLETGAPADCDPHLVALLTCAEDPLAHICRDLLADPATAFDRPENVARINAALAAFADAGLPAEAPAEETADAPSEDPAPEDGDTDVDTAEESPEPEPEAVAAEQADPEPADASEASALDAGPEVEATSDADADLREAEAEAAAAEVERLLREAEAAAVEEPEVVEEIIAEAEPAPVEAPAPRLSARDQALIEELASRPEVATALGILGAALAREEAADPEAADAAGSVEPAQPAEVMEDEVTADEIRRSTEDFGSRLTLEADAQALAEGRVGRPNRDLERAGLAALGALAVGMMIDRNRVVARGDERVIVQRDDGDLAIWRDDDAILRAEGGNRRIERYADGTSVSEWMRADGTRVVTVRDATGRVLSRQRVLADGTVIRLFDDALRVEPVDVAALPEMRYRELRLGPRTDPDRALLLLEQAEADARAVDRAFSLRQIREVRQVRELVPVLSPDPITFETNRANIRSDEVPKLLQVGRVMARLIERNPREVFLIEGHTDATGPAAYNLGLSDRRAESVALALTEFFGIPPENMIVQGYGERYLRVPTQAAEERNRRVVVRRITPLLPAG